MRAVAGQWALEVAANGVDLGLDTSNVESISIINNIHQHLPSFYVTFKDISGRALEDIIGDGSEISVSMGVDDNLYNGKFRAMGMPNIALGGSYNMISLKAAFDRIGWMKKIVDRNYKGNSSDVISKIAKEAGLTADVHTTNDMMNWLPNRTTLVQYARHVAERSFSSETSAMLLATTDTGKVRFRDLDSIIGESSKLLFSDFDSKAIPILNYSVTPKSEVANAAQGYGSTSIGMNEDGSIFEGNKIQMTMMSAANSISSIFQEAIGATGSRVNFMPPLSGNTHENWYKALHQNSRIKSSYAFDVQMITNRVTGLELLDTVDVDPKNYATGGVAKSLSGKYIVTAIVKTIMKNRYFEKIVVTSQGPGGV